MSEMKHFDLHGDHVAYQDVGDGEPVLLIHGMAGSSATWRAITPMLSRNYRVITPDLPGHGASAKPRGYFLDLRPGRSFVEYAVSRGLQTFLISWRNPQKEHADWDLDTYAADPARDRRSP